MSRSGRSARRPAGATWLQVYGDKNAEVAAGPEFQRVFEAAANARELLVLGRELHERLATLGGHVTKMGASLRRSVETYNSMVGTLETRVLVTSRRMHELDLAAEPVPAPPWRMAAKAEGMSRAAPTATVARMGLACSMHRTNSW